eukprot:110137-Hanusia_phi.AAC.2
MALLNVSASSEAARRSMLNLRLPQTLQLVQLREESEEERLSLVLLKNLALVEMEEEEMTEFYKVGERRETRGREDEGG